MTRSILDAARALFVAEGYLNVSIRKIADRIEYSPASIYSYFPSKDDIFYALAEEGFLYHMDDFSDDVPRWDVVETDAGPRAIVIVPYALDSNDMKFWLAPGYTPEQWRWTPEFWRQGVHPDDQATVFEVDERSNRKDRALYLAADADLMAARSAVRAAVPGAVEVNKVEAPRE